MKISKQDFIDETMKHKDKYSEAMLSDFIDYWTETDFKGNKMRWQGQKFFEVGKRLATWYKNSLKFNHPSNNNYAPINDYLKNRGY
jgi:hypothetical protein